MSRKGLDSGVLHLELGQQSRVHTVLTAPVLNIAVKFICSSPVKRTMW